MGIAYFSRISTSTVGSRDNFRNQEFRCPTRVAVYCRCEESRPCCRRGRVELFQHQHWAEGSRRSLATAALVGTQAGSVSTDSSPSSVDVVAYRLAGRSTCRPGLSTTSVEGRIDVGREKCKKEGGGAGWREVAGQRATGWLAGGGLL
jgi:hypothetical protein